MAQKAVLKASEYSFAPLTKEITLVGYSSNTQLPHIFLVTNVTTNQVIYQFNKVGYGGSYNQGTGVLTLVFDTTAMNALDELEIIIQSDDVIDTQLAEIAGYGANSTGYLSNIETATALAAANQLTDAQLRATPVPVELDVPTGDNNELLVAVQTLGILLQRAVNVLLDLAPAIRNTGGTSLRVDLTDSGSLNTISNITNVSNVQAITALSDQTNIGGRPAYFVPDSVMILSSDNLLQRTINY